MPPRRGNPRGRIGGGTRSLGVGSKTPGLAALVPEHVARTISPQPSLFWYLTAVPEDGTRFVFTLIDDRSPDPVHEGTIPTPTRAGVQRVSLAERGLELELGVEYEWSVALVLDPERRSSDVVATGWIDRVPRPAELAGSLGSLPGLPAVRMYAESGLWYDAFGTLSDLIERDPKDVSLPAMRAALLEQAGLVEVAEQER